MISEELKAIQEHDIILEPHRPCLLFKLSILLPIIMAPTLDLIAILQPKAGKAGRVRLLSILSILFPPPRGSQLTPFAGRRTPERNCRVCREERAGNTPI